MTLGRRLLLALGAVFVMSVIGCSSDRLAAQRAAGVVLLVATSSGGGGSAELAGTVNVGTGGCVSMTLDGEQRAFPVLWPKGTRLAEDGKSIKIPGLGTVRLGERVTGGGEDVSDAAARGYDAIPASCLADGARVLVLGAATGQGPPRTIP